MMGCSESHREVWTPITNTSPLFYHDTKPNADARRIVQTLLRRDNAGRASWPGQPLTSPLPAVTAKSLAVNKLLLSFASSSLSFPLSAPSSPRKSCIIPTRIRITTQLLIFKKDCPSPNLHFLLTRRIGEPGCRLLIGVNIQESQNNIRAAGVTDLALDFTMRHDFHGRGRSKIMFSSALLVKTAFLTLSLSHTHTHTQAPLQEKILTLCS
jgi:hypothetical protein